MSERKRPPRKDSTLAALLHEKPKRGRPRRSVSRQSVYVALSDDQKETISRLSELLPDGYKRSDVPDLAISLLAERLENVRQAVADRDRELPEGITDLYSLYFLWDLPLSSKAAATKWTSIRLSPQQAVEFGRLQGTFKAMFGANRSQVFSLALALLAQSLQEAQTPSNSLEQLKIGS